MNIQFQFSPEKSVEAAAVLLKLNGGSIKYLGLLKMLYIADRVSLQRMEQPITGDFYVSMDYGPVLSGVYDLIKGNPVGNALTLWSQFISARHRHKILLRSDPGNQHLCQEEEEILEEVYRNFGHLDPFKVAEWTHSLPEWKDPHGSIIPISVQEVLHYLEKTDLEIQAIAEEAAREAYLNGAWHG
jgi:uncharacterized phage-associated protein